MPKFTVSPSRIARYYFHECDRYLRYTSTPKERRAGEGVPPRRAHRSAIADALLDGGYRWEDRIREEFLAGRVVVGTDGEPGAPVHESRHDAANTVAALLGAGDGQAVYQGTLSAPPSFYAAYGLDPDFVTVVDCYPDLLWVADPSGGARPEVRVADAKATDTARLAHRIQVGLYALILDHVLAAAGHAGRFAETRQGGVWLYGQAEPEWFDLARIIPPLETFLRHDLVRVLSGRAEDAFWHLSRRCEWCDWYPSCREEADTTQNVSLMPALSSFAKRHLAETSPPVTTLADLGELLERPDAADQLAGCASLEGRERSLRLQVDALLHDTEQPTGAASVAMPMAEHVMVVMTLQDEPLTGSLYGYSIRRAKGADLFGKGLAEATRVAPDGDEATIAGLRRHLVADLMAILGPVDAWNRTHEVWKEQKTVQVFVFDSYERDLLVEALLAAVLDPEVAEEALALLFWFQRPELVDADDHPSAEVFFPVVIVSQVVRALIALPVTVTYRLADVCAALASSTYAADYRPSEFFAFHLSNRMKSDAIFSVWEEAKTERIEWIEKELSRRTWAVNSVIAGLRERLEGSGALFAWPPKFFLPDGLDFRHPVLSRLAFVARYEAVLGYLETRTQRGAPAEERLARGDSVRLVYLGDGRYRVDGDPDAVDLEADDFPNWILTLDTERGRRARLTFDDFAWRDRAYAPRHLDLALATVTAVGDGVVEVELKGGEQFTPPEPGDVCILEERFTDWLSDKLVAELAALDAEDDPWFVGLLGDAAGQRRTLAVGAAGREAAELARRAGMTPSQLAAFDGVLSHDVQLVWGPPGTGKTHFLATSILCLVDAARRAGRPLRILLTAFTNAAIDNLLAKLTELQGSLGLGADVPVRKVGRLGASSPVPLLAPRDAAGFARHHEVVVFGATVWQARKVEPSDLAYDVVVIDEGSQLKVGEAALAARRLRRGGRLVVAGDHKQLPPVVRGEYPQGDGSPPVAGSILDCLRASDPDDVLLAALVENFRMCDVLCAYPAASIYPADYGPFDAEVAGRRLTLSPAPPPGSASADPGTEALIDAVLDPAYPLVVCVLEDVKATAHNPIEAALVARVVETLRERMPVAGDDEFHDEAVFVVSPHHAQIRAVRRSLRILRCWDRLPQVDTVDKTQGQERDAVVISYGVSDVEYALGEREFIYSLNRLNVAITRAKRKSIVFLSRRLLEPPIQALDHDDVADGVAFMQGLAHWCAQSGGSVLQMIAGGERLTVLRGSAT